MGTNGDNWKPTVKQKRFIEEYCTDFNAARAARDAGYDPQYAKEIGFRLIHHSRLKPLITAHMAALTEKTGVTTQYVIDRIDRLAGKCEDEESKAWNPHVSAKCLELLGKHTGAFEADNLQKDLGTKIQILQFNPQATNASDTGELQANDAPAVVHSDSPTRCIDAEVVPDEEDNQ